MSFLHRRSAQITLVWLGLCSIAVLLTVAGSVVAQPEKDAPRVKGDRKKGPRSVPSVPSSVITKDDVGVQFKDPRAFHGYMLLSPMAVKKVYLIDMEGRVVNTWDCKVKPALSAYLLPNGDLLRPGSLGLGEAPFSGAGTGGRIQKFNWNGELVWDYRFVSETQVPHHDIYPLPNGNILFIVSVKKTKEEAVAIGRNPVSIGDMLLDDAIYEVQPSGKDSGKIVWEWHGWDHLVQDLDKTKKNFNRVSAHPELIDVNFGDNVVASMIASGDAEKLRSIGYIGGPPASASDRNSANGGIAPDLLHINSVSYNSELDQIALSVHNFNEVWIIDHGTTTAEAAGHTGGKRGKGGDLLYRWGNPRAYRSGTNVDQKLFHQHDAHWIPKGLPGEGHLLVFNNGSRLGQRTYSSVDEIVLPLDDKGGYSRKPGLPYEPKSPVWSYTAPEKADFFAMLISGAQRQPNGNTLICSGTAGVLFEVTPEGETVWEYVNPIKSAGGPSANKTTAGPRGKSGRGNILAKSAPKGSAVFRCYRYPPDYPGLVGKDLTPGEFLEDDEDSVVGDDAGETSAGDDLPIEKRRKRASNGD